MPLQIMRTFFLLSSALLYAQEYPLGPDSQPRPDVAKGTITRHVLPPGRFYPGTPHNYALYVPTRYDASKPTPFMIFLDGSGPLGNQQRVPTVFDNLIAKGDIPPMIGIFIDPGVLPAVAGDAQQNRYERIFEYDSLSGRFAQFLNDELIAEVGRQYNLSKNPDDHAIAGVSTGAVGAFVAAWQRPDLFRRVLSFIGTYVHMKGADSLPAMIRRTEPKPIRLYLEAGRNDHIVPGQPYGVFFAGSWPINNQLMYEALQFAGYDVKLDLGENAHNMSHGSAIMPDAIRWLWRDYPKPIVARNPEAMGKPGWEPRGQVLSVVSLDKPWEAIAGDYQSATSVATNKDGEVFFADATRIFKIDGLAASVFREASGGSALRFGPDERLYAAQPSKHRIVSFGPKGDEKLVARDVDASDMAITAKGSIYYVDANKGTVELVEAAGVKRVLMQRSDDFPAPAALTVSPDQGLLIVADKQSRFSWSYQIAKDGSLINGEPYFRVDMPEMSNYGGVIGVTVDSIGQVYFATALGIQYCEQNGRSAGIAAKPDPAGALTSLAFGGKDLAWLYVTEGGKVYRRESKAKGVATWAPVKPPKPPL